MSTKKWVLEPHHSQIQFKVKHLMITNVTGSFNTINATIESDGEKFDHASVTFTAETATINTNSKQRDTHLRSADFFDTEKYPQIKFTATDYNSSAGKISGNLTMKDVTKPITLDVEFMGINKDSYGNIKAGFSLSGKLNRTEWGLTWNAPVEAGGVLVSEEVKLSAELQFVEQV